MNTILNFIFSASFIYLIVIGVILFFIICSTISIVDQYEKGLIFRLGKFSKVANPGVNFLVPFLDNIVKVDTRIVTLNLENQQTITKDNVSVMLNAVLWYQVADVEKSILEVTDFHQSIGEFTTATLRSMIGKHNLDELLSTRDAINIELKTITNKTAEKWGLSVEDLEIKDIELPDNIQRAMAMEAEAIREKKARLIKADAELEASHKLAEAAKIVQQNPASLELRRMQMLTEIGAEQNTTTIVMIPSEMTVLASKAAEYLSKK